MHKGNEIVRCFALTHGGGLECCGKFWRASRMLQFCLHPGGTSNIPGSPSSQVLVTIRLCLSVWYCEREQAKKLDEQDNQEVFHGGS